MTDTSRIVHSVHGDFALPEPKTLLEASLLPPQYPVEPQRNPSDPAPLFVPTSRLFGKTQRYPQIVDQPTVTQCLRATRSSDILEMGAAGLVVGLLGLGDANLSRKSPFGSVGAAFFFWGFVAPIVFFRRSHGRLTGVFENSREQQKFGHGEVQGEAMRIVRKRVFSSKEDDETFMSRYLDHVENPSYADMVDYLGNRPETLRRLEKEGLSLESFKRYPSDALKENPKLQEFYKTIVGNTPDLQNFFLQHPEAVDLLRDNPWALQEYEHGNRFLAKMYRIWTQPEVHDFLQSEPAYISNFMYNKISWDNLVEFSNDWKSSRL